MTTTKNEKIAGGDGDSLVNDNQNDDIVCTINHSRIASHCQNSQNSQNEQLNIEDHIDSLLTQTKQQMTRHPAGFSTKMSTR